MSWLSGDHSAWDQTFIHRHRLHQRVNLRLEVFVEIQAGILEILSVAGGVVFTGWSQLVDRGSDRHGPVFFQLQHLLRGPAGVQSCKHGEVLLSDWNQANFGNCIS